MIRYTQGNLLEASTEALINTVNEVGVMGKGIALMFRESFPENARVYEAACKAGDVRVGKMLVIKERDLTGERWIINFPTKKHWRNPSKVEWIREGLKDLASHSRERDSFGRGSAFGVRQWRTGMDSGATRDRSRAVGTGGRRGNRLSADQRLSECTEAGRVETLTPARCLIVDLVRRYSVLGLDCTNLEVQKLAWFLHRVVHKLSLPDILNSPPRQQNGPYADNLRHLLNGLDGSYLHCEKRLSDAGPFDLIWFEDSKRADVVILVATFASRIFRRWMRLQGLLTVLNPL